MTLVELLARVAAARIELRADGNALRARAPRGAMTAELRAALEDHKPAVLEWLMLGGDPAVLDAARARLPDPGQPLARPEYAPITECFARCAERRPDAPAISRGPRTWSYRELDRASRLLAGRLARRGIGRGQIVGVRGEQSFGLIAHLIAVLRRAAVVLPIDPALPARRQQVMLDAAGAALLVDSDPAPADDAPGSKVVHLGDDLDAAAAAREPGEAGPAAQVAGRDPAYVFFTSGTTGVPKGVVGCHAGLAHFLDWQRAAFAIDAHDRCAQLTNLSFDVVLRSIFLPLTSGACLCLPERADDAAPESVWTFMADQRVTLVHAVPALAQHWLTGLAAAARLPPLHHVFFAGEPLTADLVRRWRAALGARCKVVNLYGPTETTLAKCYYRVPAEPRPGVQPVGAPLPSTQVLVLDADGRLCDAGASGEVYIRTPFRSLGYLNAPAEQAARFVVNPFGGDPDDLLYRTGDRGRYRLDGALELLGRIDDQVKIHGVRVEPAEVNAVLAEHPGVAACFTAARELDGDRALVAYYVPGPSAPATSELRGHLASRLPAAMVPAALIALDHLPLTANGKVDRQALPDPGSRSAVERDGAAVRSRSEPRTPTETLVREIWRELLPIDQVGVHDGFFDVGGHSLLATQVLARVRQRTGVTLALRAVFEATTIAQLAARIERARGGPATAAPPPLARAEPVEPLPLSYAQERLWFLHELEPTAAGYGLSNAVRVRSAIDRSALAAALRDLAARHDTLRTTFGARGGVPYQRIARQPDVPLDAIDLGDRPAHERLAAAADCVHRAAEQPFDLARGPVLRATLIRLADADHVVAIHVHHIAADGWSLGVLVEELAAAYQARLAGTTAALPALAIQYADYVAWQRTWMERGDLARQVDHFVERLTGAPAVLDLPTDRPRPAVQSFRGATAELWLPPDVVAGIAALSARTQATPAISLLALFGALLYRHSGQRDFAVGMPIANRQQVELEPLIGMFANTIVLRLDLAGDPSGELSIDALLVRVRDETLAAYAHQDAPFEKVVERLQPGRDLRRNPVFQVMYAYQNTPPRPRDGGLVAEPFEVPGQAVRFDLELRAIEDGGRLRLLLDYASDLFDAGTAARMLRRLRTLIEAAVAAPATAVDDIALLDAEERALVVETWNATERPYPHGRSFSALLADQVARRPEAIAASDGITRLSYRELSDRADRIAATLARGGAGSDALVPILAPRGAALLTAIAGVLRAGAAYVPIDPGYPAARIRRILDQTAARQVICAGSARAALDDLLGDPARGVAVHDIDAIAARDAGAAPPLPDEPAALAYVIFTSGSTGQPKGAMVHARGMVNHLFTKIDELGLGDADVLIQNASQCFDISVWQFLAPLVVGGRVEIVGDDIALDPARLAGVVERERVTVLEVVPSLLRELVGIDGVGRACGALRWLVATGEALPPELCAQWQARVPGVPILNAYGPTECSDDTHVHRVPDHSALGASVPIGRAVGNMRGYVLDRSMQPCPIGVVGELFIGGVGVGRGYLGEPGLTAQAFVPDPFAGPPGARLYRTRDLVVARPGGELEFLGRTDDQVKVRGFRIELREVEAALAALPGIRAAAAASRVDSSGHTRLVGFVVIDPGPTSDDALRAAAAAQLPDYLVPSVFVRLAALPLSANGKLDRRALAAIELPAPPPATRVAPRSDTEARLAEIWCQVLGVAAVGATDDFFRIGGHSLSASQVAARIRAGFGIELPLRTVFESPTLEALAAAVELAEIEASGADEVAALVDELDGLSDDELEDQIERRRARGQR